MKKLRFTCTRCGNCCTDKNTIVNLTYLDILRIKKGLDLKIDEVLDIIGFYIYNKKLTDEEKKKMIVAPVETEKGLAFVGLLKNSLGGCYFFSSEKKKCLIYNLRPMFCRTFPFSFEFLNEDKKKEPNRKIDIFYTEKGKQYCPGISDKSPPIDYNKWFKLGIKTLEELKKNDNVIKEWNNLVKKGKIKPTVKTFLNIIFKLDDY